MYYPDLSLQIKTPDEPHPNTRYVGWLDKQHDFTKGQVPEVFLDRLWIYCRNAVLLSFGYHGCDWCNEDFSVAATRGSEQLSLGSAEIRVLGIGAIAYAAPDLIYHYVTRHNYCPPPEFIEAVMTKPLPPESEEYQKLYGDL
jgi:hypothetical protein